MSCFYQMNELDIPFSTTDLDDRVFYTLRVCKDCRAAWMQAIETWFDEVPDRKPPGSGIFVRRHGTSVEVSEEEWYRLNPGREPVRVSVEDE